MNIQPIAINPVTRHLTRRLVWFESPEQALADPMRFLAYAFAAPRAADMAIVHTYFSKDELRHTLKSVPHGIIDARSWAYWRLMLDLGDAPALPERKFG